ncbi:MAG: AraC family transcriptional regulator [Acidobacteriota bacterium]
MLQDMEGTPRQVLEESADYWRDPSFAPMDLLRATYLTHRFSLHYHEEYVFGVIERGRYEFDFMGGRREIHAGQVLAINPGEVHSGYAKDEAGWSYRSFYPDAAWVTEVARELGYGGKRPHFRGPVLDDPILAAKVVAFHRSMEDREARLVRDVTYQDLLTHLLRYAEHRPRDQRAGHEPHAVARARELLSNRFHEDMSLTCLAKETGISPFYLSRAFKKAFGLPPHRFLILKRVQEARQSLLAGHRISDVASDVGFADQSHLTRHFKNVYGTPPGRFVAAQQASRPPIKISQAS